jgi:hypothetical protein
MLQQVLVLHNRSFEIGWLPNTVGNLYRFPRQENRSSYFRLCEFDKIQSIDASEFQAENSESLSCSATCSSTTQCIVKYMVDDEFFSIQLDCTPDQFVELLKFYRQVESTADLLDQVFGP